MKSKDFSAPQRMSKSAYVVFLTNSLKLYLRLSLIPIGINLYNVAKEYTLLKTILMFLSLLTTTLVLAIVTAFIRYYYKKYYVENGYIIFVHGLIRRETTHIPLHKIQSLRTKRGLIYRLLDMRGVSFDTLASRNEEIELILDEEDWEALMNRVKVQESLNEVQPTDEVQSHTYEVSIPSSNQILHLSNLNLIKGAFCQNHLKGMAVLFTIAATIYNETSSVNKQYASDFIYYMGNQAESLAFSLFDAIGLLATIYLIVLFLWVTKVLFQHYNRYLQINSEQIFFESGLLSRMSSRFSFDKICTIYIKQNLLERILRCKTLMLKQAFNATDEKKEADIKLYGSNHEGTILEWWLGQSYTTSPVFARAQSGWGVWGYSVRFDIVIVVAAAAALYHFNLYYGLFIPVLYALIASVKGMLSVCRSSIVLKEDYLEVHTGKFATITNYLKYDNIEVVKLVSTPFTPYFHRLNLTIATNGTHFTIRSLNITEAKNIYEWLLYRCISSDAT